MKIIYALFFLFGGLPIFSIAAENITVEASPISQFKIGSTQTQFGRLKFVGGLQLSSVNKNFGSLSAFRFLDNGTQFLSVSDSGFWVSGLINRDESHKPVSMSTVVIASMTAAHTDKETQKRTTDAEGLAVNGSRLSVSFERTHRISTGTLDFKTFEFKSKDEVLPLSAQKLSSNRGFEAIAYSPIGSNLLGARVVVSERSLDQNGNLYAAILDGSHQGVFFIKRTDDYDVTDGDFLPNGDFLILERKVSIFSGLKMRIRQIKAGTLQKNAILDGDILLESNMTYQIDNMEGLDVWQRYDGQTMISLISDDNHSSFQRSLYLEFEF
jgi:hypothetical protein